MTPVMSCAALSLTDVEGLVQPICADPRVSAVAIFGSVARGDADARSDIDVLVVHDGAIPDDLADHVPNSVTMAFYTGPRLAQISLRSPLFALHLSREASIVSDSGGEIARALRNVGGISRTVASELMASTTAKLDELLRRPRRLEMTPAVAAAELYAIAKQAAMTLGAMDSTPCFNRHVALHRAYSSLSLAAADRAQIDSLEEHWQIARCGAPDPEVAVDIERATTAVRNLLASSTR